MVLSRLLVATPYNGSITVRTPAPRDHRWRGEGRQRGERRRRGRRRWRRSAHGGGACGGEGRG
eukprot:scaffold7665_cov97-Phaeocystis_antarctica.AAC.1